MLSGQHCSQSKEGHHNSVATYQGTIWWWSEETPFVKPSGLQQSLLTRVTAWSAASVANLSAVTSQFGPQQK